MLRGTSRPPHCGAIARWEINPHGDPLRLSEVAEEVREADMVIVGSYVPEGVPVGEWVIKTARGIKAFYDIDTPVTLEALEAAERVGMELPYSCRAGVCSTCRAKITRGTAEMATNYALEPWEVQAGFILCCQARPTSGELELTYDER